MYTSDEKYEVILNSVADINMSNWQITKTLDTMTMVNNKFVILSIINKSYLELYSILNCFKKHISKDFAFAIYQYEIIIFY